MNKQAVLEFFEAEDENQAKRNLYKFTDCGAFIEFEDDGIVIGSIVEGSDNGTETFHLKYGQFDKVKLNETIETIEKQASLIWAWANEVRENGKTDAENGLDWPLL